MGYRCNFFLLTVNGQTRHIKWLLMTRLNCVPKNREVLGAVRTAATLELAGSICANIVGLRKMSGKFLADLYQTWGEPNWFLESTPFNAAKHIPDQITVHEYLTIIGNIYLNTDDPGYFIDYVQAGVPLFRGGIDLGTQSAPDLFSALELLSLYANNRPGYHQHGIIVDADRTGLELTSTIDLGPGRSIIVETPLLIFSRLASRSFGHPASEALVELRHAPTSCAARYAAALGCEVRYNADRDAISFPESLCKRRSMTYDADLWRTAVFRCKEEERIRASEHLLFDIRSRAATFLAEHGRPPRLAELAKQSSVSSRTLIRRLRSENSTYHELVEESLKGLCAELLAQPDLKISAIAERLGFADPSSFYRSFRRWYDITPGEFRLRLV
jgi:AraC-like DNA-binding protein